MKLIQINAWYGRLSGPLIRLIREESPDFLCMQEAFAPETEGFALFNDQFGFMNEVEKACQFGHHFFTPTWGFELSGEIIDFGNIIYSKHPISSESSLFTNGRYSVKQRDDAEYNLRALQNCIAKLPNGKKLNIANYQGYLTGTDSNGNEVSVSTIGKALDKLRPLSGPLVFCGDMNVNPTSPAIKAVEQMGLRNLVTEHNVKATLSYAHRAPQKNRDSVVCDFIFVSDDIKVEKFSVSEEIVSDHKALILEFSL